MECNTVCYKTKEPICYKNGLQCDEFLAYYCYKSDKDITAEVARINAEKPNRLPTGEPIDWTEIDYFFPRLQVPMED